MTYETIYSRITVKPKGEPIFSELATDIEVDDEAAGLFVKVVQHTDPDVSSAIRIDTEEWDSIKYAIEEMIDLCRVQNSKSKHHDPSSL